MELTDSLEKIDQLKAEAESLRPVSKENLARLNQKLRLDWSYHSNAIEGNTLTLSETKMLIVHGYHMGGKLGRHYEEIKLHNDVLLVLEDLVRNNELTSEVLIRNLHKQMMGEEYWITAYDSNNNEVRVKGRPGEYKDRPNMVRTESGEYKYFATVEETPSQMYDLVQWYREQEEKRELHPVIIAATFHYRFVTIHPFDDGNGRMARILMNLILMKHGFVPAIIRLNDREKYIKALALAQDGGSLEPFILHVAEETERSLTLLIKAAKGESIEEPDDLDKQIALLQRKLQADEHSIKFKKSPYVLKKLHDELIRNFIEALLLKLSKFDALFFNSNLSIYGGFMGGDGTGNDNCKDIFEVLNAVTYIMVDRVDKPAEYISITKLLFEFKKADNAFNAETTVYFFFDQYDFKIYYVIGEEGSTYPPDLNQMKDDPDVSEISEILKMYYKEDYLHIDTESLVTKISGSFFKYVEERLKGDTK